MTSKGKVECLDDYRVGNDGGIDIIRRGVNGVSTRESVGRGHFGTQENFPYDIEVLEEEGPSGLSSR